MSGSEARSQERAQEEKIWKDSLDSSWVFTHFKTGREAAKAKRLGWFRKSSPVLFTHPQAKWLRRSKVPGLAFAWRALKFSHWPGASILSSGIVHRHRNRRSIPKRGSMISVLEALLFREDMSLQAASRHTNSYFDPRKNLG